MSLSVESSVRAHHVESVPYIEAADGAPGGTFLQPAAGRIITGAGLAGGPLQQAMRHHSSIARRIVIGRQILKIVGKSSKPE